MVAASPVGLHRGKTRRFLSPRKFISEQLPWCQLWAWAYTGEHQSCSADPCRWTHVCRSLCRPCPTCPQPTVSLQCQSRPSGAVCCGAPLHIHTQGRRGTRCTAGAHWLSPASPSHGSGASGFQGEQTEEKPLWKGSAGDAIHRSGKTSMLQWHSLFVAANQLLLWSEAWPCS